MEKEEKREIYDRLLVEGKKPSEALMRIEGMETIEKEKGKPFKEKAFGKSDYKKDTPHKEDKPGLLSKVAEKLKGNGERKGEEELRRSAKDVYTEERRKQAQEYGRGRARIETKARLQKYKRELLKEERPRPQAQPAKRQQERQAPAFIRPSIHTSKLAGMSAFQPPRIEKAEKPQPKRKTTPLQRKSIFTPSKMFRR